MYQLSENEIALIYERLNKGTAKIRSIRLQLLDHICCIMEEAIATNIDFETAYQHAVENVCPNGVQEIETETFFLLNFHRQLNMKRLLFTGGFISTLLLSFSFLFRALHWPGANVISFVGFAVLLLTILSLAAFSIKNSNGFTPAEKTRMFSGLVCGILIAVGNMFKGLQYPGANLLVLIGMVILNLVFLPLFFYQLYKKSIA